MRLGRTITLLGIALAAPTGLALAQATTTCNNPNALGIARTVEVDTTGAPAFGFAQYKQHDFLLLKEIVLTFDDGPSPKNTRAVLDALAQQCTKAIFFPVGKHALRHPEIPKEVAAAGHTIGGHTWSHANLANEKSWPKRVVRNALPEASASAKRRRLSEPHPYASARRCRSQRGFDTSLRNIQHSHLARLVQACGWESF